ncbi:hypothetical protein Tco_0190512 [Tanacetum coccineum]
MYPIGSSFVVKGGFQPERLAQARIRRIFLDGYGVLVVRIVIFKISLFKLQNARLLLIFTITMNPTAASQIALDNALVPLEARLKIGLGPCYPAFLITANVLEIYMHQFWNTVNKVQDSSSYQFKLDNKRFRVDTKVFRDILQIYLKLPDQPFDIPPSTDEEIVSFIYELGYTGNIETLPELVVDHMHQPWRTFATVINSGAKKPMKERKFKKPASPTLKTVPTLPKEPTKKHAKKPEPAKKAVPVMKSSRKSQAGVTIKDTLGVFVSKKRALAKGKISKVDGTDFESWVLDEQQHKISGTNEGTGTKPGVPDVPKYDSKSKKKSWGDSGEEDDDDYEDESDDDNNNDDCDYNDDEDKNDDDDEADSDRTESDRSKIPDLKENVNNAKEENEEKQEYAEELYRDVNVNLREEEVEMTEADQGGTYQHNVSQQSGFEQVEEDAHVTLTVVHDSHKTEGPMQSSSVSSDFTDKLLNFENTSPTDNVIASLMDTTVCHEEPSSQTSSLFTIPIMVIPKIMSTFTITIPPPPLSFNPLPQQATLTPTPTASEATTSFPTLPDFSSVFKFNERVTNLEKIYCYIGNKQGEAIQQEIKSHTTECREEALADKREYIDHIDTSVRAIIKEEVKTQLPQILPQAVSEFATSVIEKSVTESLEAASADAEEPSHTADDSEGQQNQEFSMGKNDEQPNDKATSKVDRFKKPEKPPTPDPD